MPNTIKLKTGSGSNPSASDLIVGEIAIRTDNGKLFTKKDNGSVAEISGGGGIDDGDKGDITVSNSGDTFTIDNGVVTSAKIADGTIVNADINASAAIAGTKIDPAFDTQNITTSGTITSGNISVAGTAPTISLTDTNANDDFEIKVDGGLFEINDTTNTANRFKINSSGVVDIAGRLDANGGLAVTGNIVLGRADSSNTTDFDEQYISCNSNGAVELYHNNSVKLETSSSGVSVTGDLTVSGTVNGTATQANDIKIDEINGNTNFQVTFTTLNDTGYNRQYIDTDNGHLLYNPHTAMLSGLNITCSSNSVLSGNGSDITSLNASNISSGSISTARISDDAVTFAKVQNISNSRMLGNISGSTGDIQQLSAANVRSFINVADGATNVTNNNQLTNGAGYITSASFSDVAGGGTFTGDVDFSGGPAAVKILGNSDIRFENGNWTGESTKIQQHSSFLYIQGGSNGIVFRHSNGTDRLFINANGHFLPGANNSYNLGSSSNRFANIFTNDLNLSNKGGANKVDGTWGDWTLQEGESQVFMINNRNGKKYAINLTEIV